MMTIMGVGNVCVYIESFYTHRRIHTVVRAHMCIDRATTKPQLLWRALIIPHTIKTHRLIIAKYAELEMN